MDHDHRQMSEEEDGEPEYARMEPPELQEEYEEYDLIEALGLQGSASRESVTTQPISFQDMRQVVLDAIDSVDEELSEESLDSMSTFFSEEDIVSAFTILDHGNAIKYIAPWGKTDYEIIGDSASHLVQMDLPSRIPWYCPCADFHSSVLLRKSHVMCKHILTTLLARKLSMIVERPITADELLEVFQRTYTPEIASDEKSMEPSSPDVSTSYALEGEDVEPGLGVDLDPLALPV